MPSLQSPMQYPLSSVFYFLSPISARARWQPGPGFVECAGRLFHSFPDLSLLFNRFVDHLQAGVAAATFLFLRTGGALDKQ